MSSNWYWLVPTFFLIATLYSSVGFGGGSSYLALLVLFATDVPFIRTTALLCNLMVVSGNVYWYYHHGHINVRRFLPFVLVSVPLAYVGASLRISEQTFYTILGGTLILSALLLFQNTVGKRTLPPRSFPPWLAWLLGGSIGGLAGLVGIGGGIFLSPLLNHLRWEAPVRIAALASVFILVNSTAGIVGLVAADNFQMTLIPTLALLAAVGVGGQCGIRLSLRRFNALAIRRVTALLVMAVGLRTLIVNGLQLDIL